MGHLLGGPKSIDSVNSYLEIAVAVPLSLSLSCMLICTVPKVTPSHTLPSAQPTNCHLPKFDTGPVVTNEYKYEKMMSFETIKLEGKDDLMGLIFCTPLGLLEIFPSSPTQ